MKKLITIIYVSSMIFIWSQPPVTPKTVDTNNTITAQIEQKVEENSKKLEEVKEIKAANKEELKEIDKIDNKRKALITVISDKVNKLINRKPIVITKVVKITTQDQATLLDLSKAPLDSVCVEERRTNAFTKKKCLKWDYFKTITNSNNEKIIIKVE